MTPEHFGQQLKNALRQGVGLSGELMSIIAQCVEAYHRQLSEPAAIDEFGMDPRTIESIRPLFQFLYNTYWRVEVRGVKNIPNHKGAIIVANHSGTLPYDGAMIGMALHQNHPKKRDVRFLVEDFVYHFPYLGTIMYRIGGVRACPENAERLLKGNHLVAVFPEGVKGLGKLYRERYQLARFGRGGFVKLAIESKAPIIPCAIVGAEEIHPVIWKSSILAKSFGIPYLPITPTFPLLGPLGLIPLPSKWVILFGKAIDFSTIPPEQATDPLFIHETAEKVRNSVAALLKKGLKIRGDKVFV